MQFIYSKVVQANALKQQKKFKTYINYKCKMYVHISICEPPALNV